MKKNFFCLFKYLFFAVLTLSLISCETKFDLPHDPPPIPCLSPPNQIRLALVLGGGGAKGISHVGVLTEFERAGIPIDLIVGCSAGSVIGALYADCCSACCLKEMVKPLKTWDILDINLWYGRYGLVRGGALRRFLHQHLSCRRFEELSIPFCAVATDLIAGQPVCLSTGPVIPAIHASCAVPLVFAPVYLYKRWLVDGGVADPVPVKTAREFGASIIVAVDLSGLLPNTCPTNLFGVAKRSAEIKFLLQSESCLGGADIIIRPALGDMGLFDDKNFDRVFEAGKIAAKEAIPSILALFEEKGWALPEKEICPP